MSQNLQLTVDGAPVGMLDHRIVVVVEGFLLRRPARDLRADEDRDLASDRRRTRTHAGDRIGRMLAGAITPVCSSNSRITTPRRPRHS